MSTHATQRQERIETHHVPTEGGTLVFEVVGPGVRELVGFRDVTDWDDLTDAVRARGLGVGAALHLPELDVDQ